MAEEEKTHNHVPDICLLFNPPINPTSVLKQHGSADFFELNLEPKVKPSQIGPKMEGL